MTKTLEIHFRSLGALKKNIKAAIGSKTKFIQPKTQVFFDSVGSFRKFMTIQKIEILSLIGSRHPKSIYALAKMVDRDFASVLKDCAILEGAGFIKIEDTADPRGSKTPSLAFQYSAIVVHYPSHAYRIKFDEAA